MTESDEFPTPEDLGSLDPHDLTQLYKYFTKDDLKVMSPADIIHGLHEHPIVLAMVVKTLTPEEYGALEETIADTMADMTDENIKSYFSATWEMKQVSRQEVEKRLIKLLSEVNIPRN